MSDLVQEWLLSNKIEVLGTILGILYMLFLIRQNILTWRTGLITIVLYVMVNFQSTLYAAMGLLAYFVYTSLYSWYFGLKGDKKEDSTKVSIKKTSSSLWLKLIIASVVIIGIILYIILKFTNLNLPYISPIVIGLSMVATCIFAKNYLKQLLTGELIMPFRPYYMFLKFSGPQ